MTAPTRLGEPAGEMYTASDLANIEALAEGGLSNPDDALRLVRELLQARAALRLAKDALLHVAAAPSIKNAAFQADMQRKFFEAHEAARAALPPAGANDG